MKKRNILVAVFAVMVVASAVVKAEDRGMDFDGGAITDQKLSIDGLKDTTPDFKVALPVPVYPAKEIQNKVMLYKLRNDARQTLCKGISAKTIPPFNADIQLLINDEKVEILYSDLKVFFVSVLSENRYNTLLESNDSRLINLLSDLNNPLLSQSKQLEEVTICAVVSAVVIHYLWKIIDNVYTQVAVEVVELVKQCHKETVEVPDPNPGMGGPISWPVRSTVVH